MALIIDLSRLSAAYGPRLLAEAGHRLIRVEPAAGHEVQQDRHVPAWLRAAGDKPE